MKQVNYNDIVTEHLAEGAILNEEYHGFKEDYLVLHCLLRKYNPASVFEIGTNMGVGTNIICNAVPKAKVYSLDLPTELAHQSLQHPISEGKGDLVGSKCKRPFTQLRGDSMNFDFTNYESDAYFIDGEHDIKHVSHETTAVMQNHPKLVIWHDADMDEVYTGIIEGHEDANELFGAKYTLYRVTNTRIAYALRNSSYQL